MTVQAAEVECRNVRIAGVSGGERVAADPAVARGAGRALGPGGPARHGGGVQHRSRHPCRLPHDRLLRP